MKILEYGIWIYILKNKWPYGTKDIISVEKFEELILENKDDIYWNMTINNNFIYFDEVFNFLPESLVSSIRARTKLRPTWPGGWATGVLHTRKD